MNVKKTLFILTVLIFIFSFVSISAIASEDDTLYKTIPQHYFETIYDKTPSNYHGSCSHVAMSLLLSYYDVYWNDIFIDTKYENLNNAKSGQQRDYPELAPSIILENTALTSDQEKNKSAYLDFVSNNRDNYLHMYLISLAEQLGFYEGDSEDELLGINFVESAQLLDIYFDDLFKVNKDYYRRDGTLDNTLPVNIFVMMEYDTGVTHQDVLDKMKEELRQNNPVIYCGFRTNNSVAPQDTTAPEGVDKDGHAMVAYLEDDTGNILFHKGHYTNPFDDLNSTEYNLDIGILWIEINENLLEHECTKDYKYYKFGDYIQVCSCVAYKYVHPEHEHLNGRFSTYTETTHTYKCDWGCSIENEHNLVHQVDGNYHSLVCECGYSREESYQAICRLNGENDHVILYYCGSNYVEPHEIIYQSLSIELHQADCECGYSKEEDHAYEYEQLSDGGHTAYCVCGYSYDAKHVLLYWQSSDTNHTVVCSCGYSYTEPHNFIEQDYHTSVCADCGETVTTPHGEAYEQFSDSAHLVVCECGYEGEAPHIFTCVSISASMHRMTCVCGYTTLDIHNFRSSAMNPRYETCTACGYTRDNLGPGGGNVIMGKEEDEETE